MGKTINGINGSVFESLDAYSDFPATVEVLTDASVLESFDERLFFSVVGRGDAQREAWGIVAEGAVAELISSHLPNGEAMYRLKPDLASQLRARLVKRGFERIAELSQRAHSHCLESGDERQAAKYGVLLCEVPYLARLLERSGLAKRVLTPESLFQHLEEIPAAEFHRDPLCAAAVAWSGLALERAGETLEWISHLKKLRKGGKQEERAVDLAFTIRCLEALCLPFRRRYREAIDVIRALLDECGRDMDASIKCQVLYAFGLSFERVGKYDEAINYYLRTVAIAKIDGNTCFVSRGRYCFAWLLYWRGELDRALDVCVEEISLEGSPCEFGGFLLLRSLIEVERGDMGQARAHLAEAEARVSPFRHADIYLESKAVSARLLCAEGDFYGAYETMTAVFYLSENHPTSRNTELFVNACQAYVANLRRDLNDMRFIESKCPAGVDREDAFAAISHAYNRGNIFSLLGFRADAENEYSWARSRADASGLVTWQVLLAVSESTQAQRAGMKAPALARVHDALTKGVNAGYTSVFLDAGEPMRALLADIARGRMIGAASLRYAKRLLGLFGTRLAEENILGSFEGSTRRSAFEVLSDREQEVFSLLAAGMSRREISDSLNISLNTTKKHLSNIYQKLGVGNRTEARMLVQAEDGGVRRDP